MMAGGGSGGSTVEEKLKRRKYKVLKIRDDETDDETKELPWGAGPGCIDDIPLLDSREPWEEDRRW
jgi:hypothetical protein